MYDSLQRPPGGIVIARLHLYFFMLQLIALSASGKEQKFYFITIFQYRIKLRSFQNLAIKLNRYHLRCFHLFCNLQFAYSQTIRKF